MELILSTPQDLKQIMKIALSEFRLELKQLDSQSNETTDTRLNTAEAAAFLGITIPTLYTKNSKGELPSCKPVGTKKLFFLKSDLENYVKQGRRKTKLEIEAEATEFFNKKNGGSHER